MFHLRFVHSVSPRLSHARVFGIAAIGTTAWLLVLACIYWRERILFVDAAHILFRLINEGTLQIQAERWGSVITQGPVLLAVKAGLPLPSLMLLYSAAFNLFYLTVALLLVFRHRRADLALIFAFYFLFLVSDTFYWTNNEVHQGIGWLFLMLGEHSLGMEGNKRSIILRIFLFAGLVALALWTHPLVMLAAGFLWCFFLLEGRGIGKNRNERILFSALLLGIAVWKYMHSRTHGYDSAKLSVIDGLSLRAVPKAFSAQLVREFVGTMHTRYLVFCCTLVVSLFALVRAKRPMLTILTALYALGFFFIVAHTYPTGFDRFYIESEWMPLGFAAAVPFVLYVLPSIRPAGALAVVVVMVGWQSHWIIDCARFFQDRLVFHESVLRKMRAQAITKAVLPIPSEALRRHLLMEWSVQNESMMLSALDGDVPQRTFVFHTAGEHDSLVQALGQRTMYSTWDARAWERFNKQYFLLDTTTTYSVLSQP